MQSSIESLLSLLAPIKACASIPFEDDEPPSLSSSSSSLLSTTTFTFVGEKLNVGKEVNPEDDGTRCLLDDANNVGNDEWSDEVEKLDNFLAVTISRKSRFGLLPDDETDGIPLMYDDDADEPADENK